VFDELTN